MTVQMFRQRSLNVVALSRIRAICLSVLLAIGLGVAQSSRAVEGHTQGDLVATWNELAYELAFAEDEFATFKGHRAFAMMHLAMHDALNAINPVYELYVYQADETAADPIAAAAQAAYEVLLAQYPNAQATLDAELAGWLEQDPQGDVARATQLGQASAKAILALREDDGWDEVGTYTIQDGPGQYQPTPPWDEDDFVVPPGVYSATPFALYAKDQFRPAPPPPLTSTAYAEALAEVKTYGSAESTVRSEDQTAYAVWWMEFAEGSVNRLARQLTAEKDLDLWEAARMFAMLNITLFDTYVAVWDSKYHDNHWRPYTAIRQAATDGNPDTVPDADWEPLRETVPFPEYVSAHAAGCAASLSVLAQTFGDDVSFEMETITAPEDMPTRSFTSFSEAAEECADSRVMLGWHFRYATDEGLELGHSVMAYTHDNYLQRR